VRFRLEQPLPATPEAAIEALVDPDLLAKLAELPRLGSPTVLERTEDGDVIRLRVRHRFAGHLSPAVTRVVDPNRLVWVEETTYHRAAATATLRILPEHYADRLRAGGTYRFVPDGPGSCTRIIEGEVAVRFPLVGGKVERAIVAGLEDHLREEAALVARWLHR
jgi:hypothetical protein